MDDRDRQYNFKLSKKKKQSTSTKSRHKKVVHNLVLFRIRFFFRFVQAVSYNSLRVCMWPCVRKYISNISFHFDFICIFVGLVGVYLLYLLFCIEQGSSTFYACFVMRTNIVCTMRIYIYIYIYMWKTKPIHTHIHEY